MTFSGKEPTVSRALAGFEKSYFINPGAVIEQGGTLHMFANVFSMWPGHVDVPHLTSTDGASWTLAKKSPVLTNDDVPLSDPGMDVSTGFIDAKGTWVLIFETVSISNPWRLGRATAKGPDGPWQVDPKPILEAGPAGSFDAGGLSWPSVVGTADGYLLYYTGLDRRGGLGAIGMATSPDGVTWTKTSAPVLVPDQNWELGSVDRPRVAKTDEQFVMVYAGRDLRRRGIATSDDGKTWKKQPDGPVIDAKAFPVAGQSWDAALVYHGGVLQYFLEIGSGSGPAGTNIYRAIVES